MKVAWRHPLAVAASAALALALAACGTGKETSMSQDDSNNEARAQVVRVVQILGAADPADLGWKGSGAQQQLAEISDVTAVLAAIARDASQPDTVRFKAYEANVALGVAIPAAEQPDAARVYTRALAATEWHDAWGYPDGSPSGAGRRVVAFGPAVVGPLVEMLSNTTPLQYEGSEEPTLAEERQYRVKDLVGSWLAVLLGQPFDAEEDDPAARDEALARLAAAAKASGG